MTRDEFASLPPMIALGLIWDVASSRLKDMPMPHVPKAPLYDGRLAKGRDGFIWMSEMLLRDLERWEAAKLRSAETENQWTEANRKAAATLAKWIEWRRVSPNECWSGKRGDERATGAPPSREPKMNAWPTKSEKQAGSSKGKSGPRTEQRDEEDEGYGF